jgi:hypothetical protein
LCLAGGQLSGFRWLAGLAKPDSRHPPGTDGTREFAGLATLFSDSSNVRERA